MRLGPGGIGRRHVIALAAVSLLAGSRAGASPAAEAAIGKILQGRTPKEGRIKLDLPAIAENGLVVPLNVEVESPMTEADHVKTVWIVAEANPNPLAAAFHFTPACGRAACSTRIRLADTQMIHGYVEMSDGSLFATKAEVKVTIGGCGG